MISVKLFRRLFFVAIAVASLPLSAQRLNKFSGDSTKFIGELNTFFSTISDNDRKSVELTMVEFIQNWNSEQFSPSKKKIIYTLSNELLKRKVRVFPDFHNFLITLNAFVSTKQPDNQFYAWAEVLDKLTESKNSRNIVSFIDQTNGLLLHNCVYESPTTKWISSQPRYTYHYDTVPFLRFERSDLMCISNRDSLLIQETEGLYYPFTTKWVGKGGKVDWVRAGLDPSGVYATLSNYEILMKYSKYSAESVQFYNKSYFHSYLEGRLIDKVQPDVDEERSSYPRFISYERFIGIPNIFKNIDFYGGFSMEGARVIGFGDRTQDAELIFKRGGKEFVKARSHAFVIRPDRINSGSASITIFHDEDSVYHSGLQLKYIDELKELSLNRDERIAVTSPWFDAFHKVEIYCEALYWNLDQPQISFEILRGPGKEGIAILESESYYSFDRYEKIRMIDNENPLVIIRNFCQRLKRREFTLEELTRHMQKPPDQVEAQLLNLSAAGFLIYDQDNKRAIAKDKLFSYVDASNQKTDYDGIYFTSTVEGRSNALLNLETFDLKVFGVDRILLSDTQQVYVYPRNKEIVLKKNRDFTFSGRVEAGLFDFYTRDCSFEYDKFRINMPVIDTLAFYTRSNKKDPKTGDYAMVRVRSELNDLSGDLLIDDPRNKSGLKWIPKYPVFTNRDTAYVHWARKDVFDGVYDRERFFYNVLPFTLTRLDEMNPDTLRFYGSLTSAGIFPDIVQPLKIRPDYSLGFEKVTDSAGLPVYGGKGTFISKIDLSNQGMRGAGTLHYLNSVSKSDDFIFFPDSMSASVRSFVSAEQIAGVEFPAVKADSVMEMWFPYADSMTVSSLKQEMAMYNGQSTFFGTLGITPGGIRGKGTIKILDAEMDSEGFYFKQHSFDALIANFRIKSYDLALLSISTKNYRTHFDFQARRGEFKSNLGISKIEFPFNKYVCSMDRFDWMIDNEEITLMNEISQQTAISDTLSLSGLIDVGYTGSEFVSVHPLQDSLRFFALRARYNLKSNIINAEDVKIIKVADAAIFPDSGKVRIEKDARMEVLHHANIIANTKTKFHSFYDADVSIASRTNYTGTAIYDYVDHTNRRQQIRFNKIAVDSGGNTYARGHVSDTVNFMLSPEVAFVGDIRLYAPKKLLTYDGGYRPVTDCFESLPAWVKFETELDPQNLMLPVADEPRSLSSEKLVAGLIFSPAQGRVYPSFFEKKYLLSDSVMLHASGYMDFKPGTSEFRIAPEDQLKTNSTEGPAITLNTSNCVVTATGRISLGYNPGNFKMETFGTLNHYVIPDSTGARLAIALNFPFSDDALEKFRQKLMTINLSGVTLFATPYLTAMNYLIDKGDIDKLKAEIEQFGKFRRFPDEITRTLFLADVRMKWDSVTDCWISYGPIGIGSIKGELVNRYVEGKVEFSKKRNGDDFTMYFQLSPNEYFFFNYRNNILQTISSTLEYNDLIMEAQKSKNEAKRIDKIAKGFRYTISTERKRRDFLRKFEMSEE